MSLSGPYSSYADAVAACPAADIDIPCCSGVTSLPGRLIGTFTDFTCSGGLCSGWEPYLVDNSSVSTVFDPTTYVATMEIPLRFLTGGWITDALEENPIKFKLVYNCEPTFGGSIRLYYYGDDASGGCGAADAMRRYKPDTSGDFITFEGLMLGSNPYTFTYLTDSGGGCTPAPSRPLALPGSYTQGPETPVSGGEFNLQITSYYGSGGICGGVPVLIMNMNVVFDE